jgi:ABC-type spermidine/putrescine transport system permease subunit II
LLCSSISVRCRIARAVATTERRTEELRDIAGKLGLANINALAPQSTVTLPQIKASVIAGGIFAFIPRSMKRL